MYKVRGGIGGGGGGSSRSELVGGPLDRKRINDALDKHLEKSSPSTPRGLNNSNKDKERSSIPSTSAGKLQLDYRTASLSKNKCSDDTIENVKKDTVLALVAYAGYLVWLYKNANYIDRPISSPRAHREAVQRELMMELQTNNNARCVLRMGFDAFTELVSILCDKNLLRDTKFSFVEEQVAKFLYTISGQSRTRSASFFFRCSGETVSRQSYQVLKAILNLEDQFLVQPNGSSIPQKILEDSRRFYPYFQNCVGAIDGTHIQVKVPKDSITRYRGRKGYPTMNILVASSFDLRFTYVLPGWEGSASDSRILENSLTREHKLKVPKGKFYLADEGYMLRSGFITPYRSTRYHLKEYSQRRPENAKELFNLRHASLHNSVERSFGVLKSRFPILSQDARYDVDTTSDIVLACCILNNFLMNVDSDEEFIARVDRELMYVEAEDEHLIGGVVSRGEDGRRGEMIRETIAAQMWHDYVAQH